MPEISQKFLVSIKNTFFEFVISSDYYYPFDMAACPVCYASVEQAMSLIPVEPSASPVLNTLDFISDENLVERGTLNGGSSFGGYPSLLDRDLSYDIRDSMRVHCGYVALLLSSVFICLISFIAPILKRVILFSHHLGL